MLWEGCEAETSVVGAMSEDAAVEALALLFVGLRELLLIVAVGVAIGSFDDLLIDLTYFLRLAWRRLTVYTRHPRAAADRLAAAEQGWMAIFVPAWDEAAVIEPMLRDMIARLDYPRYRIFVGIYTNDPATRAAVARLRDPRIFHIVNPHAGPTTKADCLNMLWSALLLQEQVLGLRFKAVVLHDAEDVVHARELRVFDHLIPRKAMVQLPVVPLPDNRSPFVSGHYLDEFAETHTKDIVVREALGAAAPSAGVGCAIDRNVLAEIARQRDGLPFDPSCLTEDYELGLRVHALGGRGALVRIRASDSDPAVVATREHFPATVRAAVRQKSRWLLGIALQGWDRVGWQGGIANQLMLLRDRKAILTAMLNLLAYLSLAGALLLTLVRESYPAIGAFPPLVPEGGLLHELLAFNFAILSWRLAMRVGFTWHVHGPLEAVMAVPRTVVGNVINFLAALNALRRYVLISLGREQQRWDKTEHRYPAAQALSAE